MTYTQLGPSGLTVSTVGLGCNNFGARMPDEYVPKVVHAAIDAGVTLFDTADVYGNVGGSETLLGQALGARRSDVVIATKFGSDMRGANGADFGARGGRRYIVRAAEASLRRLGTDYIDLYQVHMWDAATPLEETLSALTNLVRQGKVRYIGVSNFTGWQLMKALCVSELKGFERFVSLQPQYSLVERNIEREVLPVCREEGLGVIPWSPLGGGFLSGKYRRGEKPPEDSRIAGASEAMEEAWARRATERNWLTLDVVDEISEETGKSYAQISLNWLLRQEDVTAPIIGARRLDQLEDNLQATGWELSAEHLRRLSEASAIEDVYPYRMIREMQRI